MEIRIAGRTVTVGTIDLECAYECYGLPESDRVGFLSNHVKEEASHPYWCWVVRLGTFTAALEIDGINPDWHSEEAYSVRTARSKLGIVLPDSEAA